MAQILLVISLIIININYNVIFLSFDFRFVFGLLFMLIMSKSFQPVVTTSTQLQ
uniref:Uncharacterized protein n=1 Tax=Schistosoma mansoni TaxID=6183 RepID=A0A5K4EVG2_SCHMA